MQEMEAVEALKAEKGEKEVSATTSLYYLSLTQRCLSGSSNSLPIPQELQVTRSFEYVTFVEPTSQS